MSFDIGFFFTYKNKVVQLPVNPESIAVSYSSNNETVEIISLGEINLLKNRKLSEMSFESFFPYQDWFSGVRTSGDFKPPEFYKDFFQTIIDDKKPCLFTVTGLNINMDVSIEDFEYEHKAGEHEDAYYTLDIKEYVYHQITPIPLDNTSSGAVVATDSNQNAPAKVVAPSEITIGCEVILNGTVHYDSYGSKPGKTFSNYRGKVNFINKKGSHPYHVTTPSGGWLGWVLPSAVKLV